MKDLREKTYILGIKIYRDRSTRLFGLSQSTYIDKMLKRFSMDQSKRGYVLMSSGISLSKCMCPKTQDEWTRMSMTPYASTKRSIMYAMLCIDPTCDGPRHRTQPDLEVEPGPGDVVLTLLSFFYPF